MRARKASKASKVTKKVGARPKIIKPSPPSRGTQGPSVAPGIEKAKLILVGQDAEWQGYGSWHHLEIYATAEELHAIESGAREFLRLMRGRAE